MPAAARIPSFLPSCAYRRFRFGIVPQGVVLLSPSGLVHALELTDADPIDRSDVLTITVATQRVSGAAASPS